MLYGHWIDADIHPENMNLETVDKDCFSVLVVRKSLQRLQFEKIRGAAVMKTQISSVLK